MINKTNNPNLKNPSFSKDSKTFQSLITDKSFREKVAKKIIEWIVNNPEINADDFDCLIIYWNRFNHELVAVKKDCVYNSYPFDNDLLSHFTVVSIRAYLLEYWGIIIHNCGVENKNNGDLLDEILEKLNNDIDETFKSWYPLVLSGYSKSDDEVDIFLELEKLFSDWIMVPLDFLSDEDQLLSFWDSFDLFREDYDDGGKRSFLPLFSKPGVTVSRFILNENFSLKEPFCYYEEQLIDYSINQLKDYEYGSNLSMFNNSLRFLNKVVKSGSDRNNQIFEEVSLFKERLLKNYKEKIKEELDKVLYYETYFNYVFQTKVNTTLVLPPEVFGIDKLQEKTINFYIEFLEENGHNPADYVSNLPEIIYQKAKEKNLLVETIKSNSNSYDESFKGPVIYSPIKADLSIVSVADYYIDFPLTDIEDMLIKSNSKTTKAVKETIETVLKIKTLKLSPTVKSHLEFVLSMDTID